MNIAIVDDDPLICASLEVILGAQHDICVSAIGTTGLDAIELYRSAQPDILLMDIRMPQCDGLEAAERILSTDPKARIVFLTTFSDDDYLVRALRMGARGYLIKQDVASIAPALRAVMNGQSVLEGVVLERMSSLQSVESSSSPGPSPARDADAAWEYPGNLAEFSALTERECEVVHLIAQGLDNKEIAAAAYMSEGTVRNHISAVLSKLELRNRTQIAIAYYRALR